MSPMANAISLEQLDDRKQQILKEFRNAVSDILLPKHTDEFLLRWLKARDFDLRKSEQMIRESFKFKKKIGAETIVDSGYELPEIYKNYVLTKFVGFDSEGSPVRIFLSGICDVKGVVNCFNLMELFEMTVFEMESDLRKCEMNGHPEAKAFYIIDLHGMQVRQFLDKQVINYGMQILSMYQDNYPELLKRVYVINAPSLFVVLYNIVKQIVHENTLNKLKIYSSSDQWKEEVFQVVDKNILPQYFGGTVEDPGYDPRIRILMKTTKVPVKYYKKSNLSLNETDPGVNIVTIRERSTFDYEMDIVEPGTIIKWEFQTKDYNIRFGVLFWSSSKVPHKNSVLPETLLPVEPVDSQVMPERGEIICEKSGKYVLHFNNTYSWLTGKQLLYKFEQMPPVPCVIQSH